MIAEPRLLPQVRRVGLQGAANFRDLGGYDTFTGSTAWGVVFRSDSLSALTRSDISVLLDLGLRSVVDLRHETELGRARCALDGHPAVRYRHCPAFIPNAQLLGTPEFLASLDLAALYCAILDGSADCFRALFTMLGDPRSYPLVFHCTYGRDRTGLAAAVVLLAAGVPTDAVIADFVLSNEYLRDRLAAESIDARTAAQLQPRPSHLLAALNHLGQQYGGVAPYLARAGVSPAQLAAFRRQFVLGPSA